MKITNQKAFINKSIQIHNKKYDYSQVNYINNKTKVCIVCTEHGEFWQRPDHHLSGVGCPICAGKTKLTTKIFIDRANKIHNDRYDYSKTNYVNAKTDVIITCKIHGDFTQNPMSHLNGHGCKECGINSSAKNRHLKREEFLKRANEIHENTYDYSQILDFSANSVASIICKKHGIFYQRIANHLNGQKCPKCAIEKNADNLRKNIKDFIKESNHVHSNKYSYENVNYKNSSELITITCPLHGCFNQRPSDHLRGCGCPKCANKLSKSEEEIIEQLQICNPQQRNRTILNGKELDIFIPSQKLGIEYNGLRWHSEEFGKDHRYHLDKLNECNKQGIKLIQIFEDEWVNHREICESKLKQICGLNHNPKIFARKCEIREIKHKFEAYEFLDKNHIQGRTGCTVALGAYYNDKLVGVMTFKQEKEGYWDLNRFATDINYQCVGIGGKLFKYFTKHYDFQEVKSFADRRWTTDPTNNLYTKLGFEFDSFVEPTYWYYNPKVAQYKRFHKFGFRKQPLHHQYGLPLTMTEHEMTTALGYTRIWDCGLIKYIYKK